MWYGFGHNGVVAGRLSVGWGLLCGMRNVRGKDCVIMYLSVDESYFQSIDAHRVMFTVSFDNKMFGETFDDLERTVVRRLKWFPYGVDTDKDERASGEFLVNLVLPGITSCWNWLQLLHVQFQTGDV